MNIPNILHSWGLIDPFVTPNPSAKLSDNVSLRLEAYVGSYPNVKHLYLVGNSFNATWVISYLVGLLLTHKEIRNRVSLFSVPQLVNDAFWNDTEVSSKIETADICIFQELGPVKLNPMQAGRLMSFISTRITNPNYHFIFTSTNHPDEVAANTHKSLMDLIVGTSDILGVGE